MEAESPLIETLLSNKVKILKIGKYNEANFELLINSLSIAEMDRQRILKKIEELGTIDIQRLSKELQLSEENILCNIEYQKELGLLGFIGEKSRFFQDVIEKSENKGVFPNVNLIKERKLCSGCGLCVSICPVNAIDYSEGTFEIDDESCIECGLCYSGCPRSFFPKVLKNLEENHDPNVKFLEEFNY